MDSNIGWNINYNKYL